MFLIPSFYSDSHIFQNRKEARTIIEICRKYKLERREYRSKVFTSTVEKSSDFLGSVITPYDGQRSLIEQMLKKENMEWADRCFNVDSFQGMLKSLHIVHPGFNIILLGNEADNIVISLVRSRGLGFLDNERRMNVMLSRCRQSMLICSSRAYLALPDVRGTLVGDVSVVNAHQSLC
jgi:superfamily I DNA and/or RNA helicase